MLKTRIRVTSCVLWIVLTALGFYSPNPVSAETYTATQETRDFYFQSQEPTTLTVRTYAQQYGIDSMLWLYDDQNTVVVANDDHFGLDSYITYEMQAGVQYRLRAGVCCGDPERWYGTSYVVDPSLEPSNVSTTLPTTTTTTSTTTTTTSTTTTSTTTTVAPTTTTTEPPTTTTEPVRTTTTTEPVQVVESTTTTSSSSTTSIAPVPPVVVLPTTTLPTQTTQAPTTSSSSIPPEVTTTTIPITPDISQDQAVAVATNPEVLQTISAEQAKEVFDAISESELTSEEAEQLVEAVQDAPLEVREQFESQINVFSGKFNNYVPIGSNINVGQRKVLIAASGLLFMAPTVPSTIGSSTSQSQSRRK